MNWLTQARNRTQYVLQKLHRKTWVLAIVGEKMEKEKWWIILFFWRFGTWLTERLSFALERDEVCGVFLRTALPVRRFWRSIPEIDKTFNLWSPITFHKGQTNLVHQKVFGGPQSRCQNTNSLYEVDEFRQQNVNTITWWIWEFQWRNHSPEFHERILLSALQPHSHYIMKIKNIILSRLIIMLENKRTEP